MDSLCHPWFTTTNVSYRFPSLKLPPPPCAVLLVDHPWIVWWFQVIQVPWQFHININGFYFQPAGGSSVVKLCFGIFRSFFSATQHDWLWINSVFMLYLFFWGEQNLQGNPSGFSVKTQGKSHGVSCQDMARALGLCSKALRRSAQGKAGVMVGLILTVRYWGHHGLSSKILGNSVLKRPGFFFLMLIDRGFWRLLMWEVFVMDSWVFNLDFQQVKNY